MPNMVKCGAKLKFPLLKLDDRRRDAKKANMHLKNRENHKLALAMKKIHSWSEKRTYRNQAIFWMVIKTCLCCHSKWSMQLWSKSERISISNRNFIAAQHSNWIQRKCLRLRNQSFSMKPWTTVWKIWIDLVNRNEVQWRFRIFKVQKS